MSTSGEVQEKDNREHISQMEIYSKLIETIEWVFLDFNGFIASDRNNERTNDREED